MFTPRPARLSLWLQTGGIFFLTCATVALLFGRWTWSDWTAPHWLEGDPLEIYARAKIAAEQPAEAVLGVKAAGKLGAPFRADWTGYPMPDRLVFIVTGWLAVNVGLIAAVQLMSAFILGLNAAAFYACTRWLRWRWEWAAAFAMAFALCTYNIRWGVTLSFSQTFTLPPLVLLCARAARPGPKMHRGWLLLAGGLGTWLGQGNPYLAYFAGVIAGGALLLAVARRVGWFRTMPLIVFLVVLPASFVFANARYLRGMASSPEATGVVRSLDDMRRYALRPADWLIPPADHRAAFLGEVGRQYHAARHAQGEFFYNYLGVLGVAGLFALLAWRIPRRRRLRWPQLEPILGFGWIIAFGVAGGANYWLGAAGMDLFRAGSRIGIYAQAWVYLFLGGLLSRRLAGVPRAFSVVLAGATLFLGIWDQTPPLHEPAARQKNLSRWQAFAALTTELERDSAPDAAVFQLPVVAFPEAGATGAMPDYDHFLPYLTSTSLRYSYGHLRSAPALRWAQHVGRLPPASMVEALEKNGFSLLWIDTRGYADGAAPLVAALQATHRATAVAAPAGMPVRVFRLQPSALPTAPDLSDPRLQDPWDEPNGPNSALALQGWYTLETSGTNRWRWAGREASLGLWSERATPVTLRFRLGGPGQSTVALRQHDQEIWRGSPGAEIHSVRVPLAAGLNTLVWRLEGRTFRPGDHDPRELGFMVENLSMSVP